MNDHAAREEAIVTTALDLAEDRGVAGVTTAGLARRLGFTEAALYRYFPGKAAIIGAALQNVSERLFATMLLELMPEAVDQGQPVPFQLERHVERFMFRGGLLLELLLYAAGGREKELQRTAAEILREYANRVHAYFMQLRELHLIDAAPDPPELTRLWICHLLGGFVRCRLSGERWKPAQQDGFQAFLGQLKRPAPLPVSPGPDPAR